MALAKFTNVTWEISRLPGKFGGLFVKALPYLPILRKLVNVKNHQFLVPEAVCLMDESPKVLETFFSGVLHMEKRQMMLWWNDERDPLYLKLKAQMNWGIMHRILGVSPVDVVIRGDFQPENPMYIAAFDMI